MKEVGRIVRAQTPGSLIWNSLSYKWLHHQEKNSSNTNEYVTMEGGIFHGVPLGK